MKVTFLGTGTSQGIPVIGSTHPVCLSHDERDKRLRVSVLIQWDDYAYVIDCGPDFRQQMLRAKCSKIDGILFTHEHSDHVAGLDDIRPFYFRQGDVDIYAHQRVIDSLTKRFDYIFEIENKYPGVPTLSVNVIENKPFYLHHLKVIPIEGMHHQLQVFGFRFDNFAYLTDMKSVEDTEIDKIKNIKVLVINALRMEPHVSHFNLEEALEFIEKVNPEVAYITHISHVLGFHEAVEKQLPNGVFLAYDSLQIHI
ncbi:MAG: MBL fold metallo-hydrolase [Flavobacteriales bacterium]|nr:MBL fold metallo-hydrolase [Flavobacteriia bacterium]NCP60446.1 MBL fold metallo-hydrolase [Flavobacteriales bacterium]PIV92851.1 MAG: MBL fold metallo-hydrolase [Flavobacteriaceae bacterium CG17_big_fil_post_rev_8_21_14_2_50_33_15]PIY12907.1 MAG: MBL fold metallo-hydrolase [Flavobacteriaceae bacterium CG_4_10_14_3_um_filter_33_47]PJB16827.1 MAG: MBL fold metallo-hydrolase [Flavobacteriaceae bacterium CG_4_9_14_3_um_filter_33_16]